jgi:hypothetical protein
MNGAALVLVTLLATVGGAHPERGWLLIVPPSYDRQDREISNPRDSYHRPLSEWVQVGAYETVSRCEYEHGNLKGARGLMGRCIPASAAGALRAPRRQGPSDGGLPRFVSPRLAPHG